MLLIIFFRLLIIFTTIGIVFRAMGLLVSVKHFFEKTRFIFGFNIIKIGRYLDEDTAQNFCVDMKGVFRIARAELLAVVFLCVGSKCFHESV